MPQDTGDDARRQYRYYRVGRRLLRVASDTEGQVRSAEVWSRADRGFTIDNRYLSRIERSEAVEELTFADFLRAINED